MKRAALLGLSVVAALALLAPSISADHDDDDDDYKDGYAHKDFSKSHLDRDWFKPACDYPWTRTLKFKRWRTPPHHTLDFFCPPVTTHLHYPELYPRNYHAGGTLNVDY